jgi:hypothetical protein
MGTGKFMILVPLFDLKSLGSFRRLRCRDFKSAALEGGKDVAGRPNPARPSHGDRTVRGNNRGVL